MFRSVLLVFLAFALSWFTPTHAEPMPARYATPLGKIFAASKAPGMVATIVDGDQVFTQGFGRTNATNSTTPDEHTLVRLNSLSKLMAGEILASLSHQGAISLGDTLQRHAPAGRRVPTVPGASAIAIRDLMIHTSGLPRDLPKALWRQRGAPGDSRWSWLAANRPVRAPGLIAEYSNVAWLLLGDAMEQAAREPYPELLQRFVTNPVQLGETTLAPNNRQCARLLAASDASCDASATTAASWGVYSTSVDMARWMQALMNAMPGTAFHTSLQPIVTRESLRGLRALDFAGHTQAIGWGWLHMTLGGEPVIQKTGGGVRTMNYIIMSPKNKRALFITVSRMDIEMLRRLAKSANLLMESLLSEAS